MHMLLILLTLCLRKLSGVSHLFSIAYAFIGNGCFYTRLLKAHGAAHVIGVDLSPEMLRLALQQEQAEPLGITYHLGDAITLPHLGPFDLITAFHLLHYATSKDQMRGMFQIGRAHV